jgi:hypothetical protein
MCSHVSEQLEPSRTKGSSQPLVPCVTPLKSPYSVTPLGGRDLLVVSYIELLVILGISPENHPTH